MNLEEIINAAVEKKLDELVTKGLNRYSGGYGDNSPASIEKIVAKAMETIAMEEVVKHEAVIRLAVVEVLKNPEVRFELQVYTNIKLPPSLL